VPAHLALAVAGDTVRIQRQERAGKMLGNAAQFAQANLELLGLLDGMTLQEIMDSRIGGYEGQAVGQFESFLGKRALMAVGTQTHRRLVDQMQTQARFDPFRGQAGPLRRVGGITRVEFFLQAEVGDDPFDAALANFDFTEPIG
jgi:hypothetical protein